MRRLATALETIIPGLGGMMPSPFVTGLLIAAVMFVFLVALRRGAKAKIPDWLIAVIPLIAGSASWWVDASGKEATPSAKIETQIQQSGDHGVNIGGDVGGDVNIGDRGNYTESQALTDKDRLNSRYPLGHSIAYSDGKGGETKFDDQEFLKRYPVLKGIHVIQELNDQITITIDTLMMSSSIPEGRPNTARDISITDSVEKFKTPQQIVRGDDSEILAEITSNARDGVILIVGARKL